MLDARAVTLSILLDQVSLFLTHQLIMYSSQKFPAYYASFLLNILLVL
jgi:hypothetical protein